MKQLSIAIILLLSPLFLLGQVNTNDRIDSLRQNLTKTTSDSAHIKLLCLMGSSFLNLNKDSSVIYTKKALGYAKQKGSKKSLGYAYHFMGYIYNKTNDYGLSMTYFDTAIQLYQAVGHERGIAEALSVYGLSAWRIGQYDKSIRAYNQILSLDDRDELKKSKLAALINSALIYEEQHDMDRAESTYKKSILLAKKIDDRYGLMIIHNNLSSIYRYAKKFKTSFEHSHQSIQLASDLNNPNELIRAQANLGASLTQAGQYDSAEYYLLLAYEKGRELKDDQRLVKNTWHLAELYLKEGKIAQGRKFGKESLLLAKDLDVIEDLAYGFEILYKVEKKANNLNLATQMADSLLYWRDSLYKANNQTELANAESAFNNKILIKENELKSSEIKRLAATKNLILIAVLLLLLSLLAGWLFYKRKRAQQELDIELRHTQRLTESIETYRKKRATELHDDVGQDLLLAQQSIQLKNSPEKTLDFIERALNKVRKISKDEFPYELSYVGLKTSLEYLIDLIEQNTDIIISEDLCELPEEIPAEQSLNIYRIFQEMINNSLKNSNSTAVFIGMDRKETLLEITYKDNGNSFDFNEQLAQSKSIGLKSIVNRVRMLKGELKYVPSITDNRYVIHVPFWKATNKS